MIRWPRIISFVGICCSSLCFLSLPLAVFLVPYGFGWLHNEAMTRIMLLMFLAMSLAGTAGAFLVHRRRGPGICAFLGASLLVGTAWRLLPPPMGWLSLALLLSAWIWDWRLMKHGIGKVNLKLRLWKLLWPIRARLQRGLAVGSVFPDFTLSDIHGQAHTLSDNPEQKLTLLWFTNFCDDCRSKIPLLGNLLAEAGDRYRVLAVNILEASDPLSRRMAQDCAFPVLFDPEDIVTRQLGLEHPPGTCPIHNLFFVDPSGRILFRRHLSAMDPEDFRSLWRRLSRRSG